MAGDFNQVIFLGERSRGGSLDSEMRMFFDVIEDLDLRDLALLGGSFTWSGGQNNQTKSRLDRFLIFEDWEDMFCDVMQSILPRPTSNHYAKGLE